VRAINGGHRFTMAKKPEARPNRGS
jgi:hypothetical protein